MGDPKKRRKAYSTPRKAFQKQRIEKERELKKTYGLKNKRELFRAETIIRKKRATARSLLALDMEERIRREKQLLESLKVMGILTGNPTLEDVLTLTPESILERRLQTIVWRKGMANTQGQARQFIVHGHIAIDGMRVDKPSYLVEADEEPKVDWFKDEIQFEMPKKKFKKGAKNTQHEESEVKKAFEESKGDLKASEESASKVAGVKKE
jgi:small subunit ribosomal protein S4